MEQQNWFVSEEEIDLMDYLKIFIKRKYEFLFVLFLIVIISIILSFVSPKVYQIKSIIEIGEISGGFLENPLIVKEKIDKGFYNNLIKERLNEKEIFKGTVEANKDSKIIVLSIESSKPQKAQRCLNELNSLILEEHQKRFDIEKKHIEQTISVIEQKINSLKEEKNELEKQIETFENLSIKDYINQFILSNLKKEYRQDDQQIQDLFYQLSSLQKQKEIITPTKVVQQPTISGPIKPNLKINIVLSLVIGIILGIFWVFLAEWWQNNRKKLFS